MASVFQNLKDSMPPLIPAPQPVGLPPDSGAMPDDSQGQIPKAMSTFQTAKPQVFKSPSAQDRQQTMLGDRLEQDYQKDLHPWGTPENHPGVFGKIAHALNHATGGDTRRGWEEQGLEKRLNDLTNQGVKNDYTTAETGKTREETAEMPGKTQSEEDLQGAETQNKLHPPEKWEPVAGWQGPNSEPMEYNSATGAYRPAPGGTGASLTKEPAAKSLEKVNVTGPDGKPIVANYHPDTGKITDASGKEIPNARPYEKSPEGPHQLMMVPDGNGGYTATNVLPGMHVGSGAQTAAGVNSMNTPTTTQRTAAGRAQTVVEMAPDVINEVAGMAQELGPIMGNWNAFMQGKVGMDNPKFAGLRTDLMMFSTAVALAHAQGRLPENLREEFDHAINAPKQTPENLISTMQHILPWMQKMQEQGGKGGAQPQGGPPQGADVQVKGHDGKMYWGNSKTKQVLGPVQ